MAPALDYILEAKKLWERLGNTEVKCCLNQYLVKILHSGINPEDINKDKRGFNPLDIIYKSPKGGCIFVGKVSSFLQFKLVITNSRW